MALAPLLLFARELQRATTFSELLSIVRDEVRARVGYRHAWLYVADDEPVTAFRLIEMASELRDEVAEVATTLPVEGDAMLEAIARGDAPIVVDDARSDPRTDKTIVERLGNRTIVNVPLRLIDRPLGAFGTGTFGDEGPRPPAPEQLDYLVAMGAQLSVACGRIRFLEERARAERERRALERRVAQLQRLESLGQLAAGVAHDFNNVLQVVLASAAMLRDTVPRAALDDVEAIVAAAEQGRRLAQGLLALGRAQPLEIDAIDVHERLRKLLPLVQRVLPGDVSVELRLDAGDAAVRADAAQLDRVLTNLLLNARDAMPDGGRIVIGTEVADVTPALRQAAPWLPAPRALCVSVADTGVGMSPDVLERAFEPFFTTKADSGGTGLGLAVSYGVVRQHQGVLTCESVLGAGATFHIYLPLAVDQAQLGVDGQLASQRAEHHGILAGGIEAEAAELQHHGLVADVGEHR